MENEISVLVGLAIVAGVIYFYKKDSKKSTPAAPATKPVAKKAPKRGPGSTPKKDTLAKKKPAVAKKTVAKKPAPKKTTAKKAGPKKGSAKPKLQVK